jgi:hypothetical protein
MELAKCPCGKTPENIGTYGEYRSKWMFAVQDCCGEWNIEFRSGYLPDGCKLDQLAIDAWNGASRSEDFVR